MAGVRVFETNLSFISEFINIIAENKINSGEAIILVRQYLLPLMFYVSWREHLNSAIRQILRPNLVSFSDVGGSTENWNSSLVSIPQIGPIFRYVINRL